MVGLVWILSDVGVTGKSSMTAINRKFICNSMHLSLYMRHDPNPISTVRTTFLWSSNTIYLVRTPADVRVALRYHGYLHTWTVYSVSIAGYLPPYLIYGSARRRTLFILVQSCC